MVSRKPVSNKAMTTRWPDRPPIATSQAPSLAVQMEPKLGRLEVNLEQIRLARRGGGRRALPGLSRSAPSRVWVLVP